MFGLKRPCDDCPFLKDGGIRLMPGRVREIAKGFTDHHGAIFPCHKSVDIDDDGEITNPGSAQMCAGGVLFAWKQGLQNQMVRIGERTGPWRAANLLGGNLAFDSLATMLKTAIRRPPRRG